MEKKQGFLSALKEDIVRGLSPSRSRSNSPARPLSLMSTTLRGNKDNHHGGAHVVKPEPLMARSGTVRPVGEALSPLMEGPEPDRGKSGDPKWVGSVIGQWVKGQFCTSTNHRRSNLRLLLGIMGAPLAPIHVSSNDPLPHLSIKDTSIETSSAHYILQQYIAATGVQKLQSSIKNAYAMGKLKMIACEYETATRIVKSCNVSRGAESGWFVLWQMNPDMWYVELAVSGCKVHAGCNGNLVWRYTPWLGAHTAKGPVRPLRRALQGLDPRTTAIMFANARCIGEKNINGEDCFILKLCAGPRTLKARSEGPAEIIRHVLFGYFSQKTGLLVQMEDSHLTRVQSTGGDTVYWETTINTFLEDYHPVEGIVIAHSGHTVVTLFRFGEVAMNHTKTKMEETWTIEEVAFNIPGLSVDCFIPPSDLSITETCEFPQDERGENAIHL
ncbi:hypothetical protein ERO13_D02G206200v2 [Gossypium hirsutum]|uniref:Uncharacterized protein isoform X1 n=4 Tax=Gossypium TaxID=3633 RepID=A0A1U8JS90_GOSHI|nr:uncharacterized protein LOC105795201 isoform X1 [Gossypium raimondii]XP_016691633.1 uncharacterized protein LOC107908861 isoform X1 [Gossypium hirsutum]KAG4159995.1 hypothetical protein ERO13_D02G206200v2 [Gossypium hirsutum]TYI94963.1 hypothetical protein E1A91_D02G243800v1 [Gossypium mustelinum]